MKQTLLCVVAVTAMAAHAPAAELRLSLGVRETNNAVGTALGANGGATGTIEWVGRPDDGVDLDVQLVPAGSWQLVTFDLNAGPIRGFTGDNVLSSTTGLGVLEHLRIANTTDGITHYKVYIDDVTNTVNGVPTLLTNFDSAAVGSEVMFQDARFSGSTSANLLTTPNTNGVSTAKAFSGLNSYELDFAFVNDNPTGAGGSGTWARVTTNGATTLLNPVIGVPGGATNTSTVSMRVFIAAVPEPATASLAGLAVLGLLSRRRRVA